MDNKFSRTINLIGEENFKILQDKHVLVIGLGGVGGYTVETLVRSGIKNITIVDFDVIDETNINRQLISNINNIGNKKTYEWIKRINSINPDTNLFVIDEFIKPDNIEILFKNKIDYIIDACDSIKTKEALIMESIQRKIKLISCMGMGNKLNPELVSITDIRKTSNDKIAKILRKFVKDNKINKKIMVVSSTELPKKKEHTIYSISYVPSVAGILCASYVINDIISENN